ncbi:uncharacterized protein LOC115219171 isoform X1 [Octopus sinensis]|uniref:Uncharacterized protein LOC115219171 isoform X1 n=1 Tax=Octopus sinensis TaxID=2607531 RepID=A0A7E6FB86_9MOLL|nr:uncharacterized protein LOC115219171 isoform X1 [Octopus sinensis]
MIPVSCFVLFAVVVPSFFAPHVAFCRFPFVVFFLGYLRFIQSVLRTTVYIVKKIPLEYHVRLSSSYLRYTFFSLPPFHSFVLLISFPSLLFLSHSALLNSSPPLPRKRCPLQALSSFFDRPPLRSVAPVCSVLFCSPPRCPPQLYGKDCINECHCSRAESCHQITGKCKRDGCEDGWYGEKCDKRTYVNIAQGQTTQQTSIYGIKGTTVFHNGTCEKMNISMASDKAVDGNFDPGFTHKSCASTDWGKDPYWQVMFDKPYTIYQLRIYNRMGNNRKYC